MRTALALLVLSAQGRADAVKYLAHHAPQYLEPNVQRYAGVIPKSVCDQLIDLGENAGFSVKVESIDAIEQEDNTTYVPSQTINVYGKGLDGKEYSTWRAKGFGPMNTAIWDLLRPWVPKIRNIVKANRDWESFAEYFPDEPNRDPELIWVFFRKYSPDDDRNSLKQHLDTNMNTVNIELSDDYEGGGLFYIKPLAENGLFPQHYNGYEFTNSMQRKNTSDIIFPDLHAGDAIFYNFTVHHAVAPVESGARYSMAFFFDDPDEFKVEIRNILPDTELDIVLVHNVGTDEGDELGAPFGNVAPNQTFRFRAFDGDVIQTLVAGTDTLVTKIEITREEQLYEITRFDDPNEFGVQFHNDLPEKQPLDFVLVYDAATGKEVWDKMLGDVAHNDTVIYHAYEGDVLWALVAGTVTLVTQIEIQRAQHLYGISHFDDPAKFEGFRLHNTLPDLQLDIESIYYNAATGKYVRKKILNAVDPNEVAIIDVFEGDIVRALIAGTETVVEDIEIKREHHIYTISTTDRLVSEL